MLPYVIAIGLLLIVIERVWPAAELPRVRAWWPRVVLVNTAQAGIVVLSGYSWDLWMGRLSLFDLSVNRFGHKDSTMFAMTTDIVITVWIFDRLRSYVIGFATHIFVASLVFAGGFHNALYHNWKYFSAS